MCQEAGGGRQSEQGADQHGWQEGGGHPETAGQSGGAAPGGLFPQPSAGRQQDRGKAECGAAEGQVIY